MKEILKEIKLKFIFYRKLYYTLSIKMRMTFMFFGMMLFIGLGAINFHSISSINSKKTELVPSIGASSYQNRDVFDFGGKLSDDLIQASFDLLKVEAGFIDNYIGAIPNPADHEIVDRTGNKVNLKTREFMDIGVVIGLSILVFTATLEGFLIVMAFSGDRYDMSINVFKNTLMAAVLIVACPYIIKYIVDFVNILNQTIINNYLVGNVFGNNTLSQGIINTMGVNSLDPNPNFITYVGISVVLLLNCFVIGINYFIFIFLAVISPLVFAFLPLSSAKRFIKDLTIKFFQCLMIWPAWIIGVSLVINIIHSSNTLGNSTILGIIGIFALTLIPSLIGGSIGSMSTMVGAGAFNFASHHIKGAASIGSDDSSSNKSNEKVENQEPKQNDKQEDQTADKEKDDLSKELSTELTNTFRYPLPVSNINDDKTKIIKKRK